MSAYEAVLNEATQLPVEQRVRLIDALWDTVPEEAVPPLSQEWIEEVERRTAEYDAGLVETIPWETVHSDAMRRSGIDEVD